MSEDYETEEYEDDMEAEEEDRPWEAFGISEADWETIWKEVRHTNIDTETIAEFFLASFPDKLMAARAYACYDLLSEELEDEW